MKRLSQEQFYTKANAIHKNNFIYSDYVNHRTYMEMKCKVCGYKFSQKPNNHLNGQGCPRCSKTTLPFSERTFIEKAKLVHGDRFDYSLFKYINSRTAGYIKCNICNTVFVQRAAAHLRGQGCPSCRVSRGELTIKNILDKHGIKNVCQYKIPEVVNRYEYDFYLPDHNLLIEFHGIQHFQYVPFFHRNGEDSFLAQKNRDDIIRSNAIQFKYNYLEFTYKELKKLDKEQFEQLVLNKISRSLKRRNNDVIR